MQMFSLTVSEAVQTYMKAQLCYELKIKQASLEFLIWSFLDQC